MLLLVYLKKIFYQISEGDYKNWGVKIMQGN